MRDSENTALAYRSNSQTLQSSLSSLKIWMPSKAKPWTATWVDDSITPHIPLQSCSPKNDIKPHPQPKNCIIPKVHTFDVTTNKQIDGIGHFLQKKQFNKNCELKNLGPDFDELIYSTWTEIADSYN